MTGLPAPDDIIDFWIGETASRPEALKAQNKIWFSGGPELDKTLKDRFLTLLEILSAGPLAADWAARGPRGAADPRIATKTGPRRKAGGPDHFRPGHALQLL